MVYLGKAIAERPNYCKKCGKPYPWTSRIISNVSELLELDEDISKSDKDLIKTAIPDLLIDTPKTRVAGVKFKKGFSKVSKVVKGPLRELLVDVMSTSIKKVVFNE